MRTKTHLKIIRGLPLWTHNRIRVQKLSGGITNFNYLIRDGNRKYVARFAQKSSALLGLNRAREMYNTKTASLFGAGPEIVEFFPKHNLLVVTYIEGDAFSPETARKQRHIKLMAKLLRKVHGGPKFKGTFNPFKTIRTYIAIARKHKSWLPNNIDALLNMLDIVEKDLRPLYKTFPCHLDLVIQNIVGTKKGVLLLDWEYSSNSDWRFDLAMLSVMGNFTYAQDKLLLTSYGITGTKTFEQIQKMKAVVCFREGAWGLLQLANSKIKFDYRKHAIKYLLKFNRYTSA